MPSLLSDEYMDAMDSGVDSDHDLVSTEMLEKFVSEVSLIHALIEEKIVIKYVIVFSKDNRNLNER